MSVNSSYGFLKFNVSLEEDKLKSIMRNAKNKGLFAFEPTSTIRIARRSSKIRTNRSKISLSKRSTKINSSIRSPNVSHTDLSPEQEYNRRNALTSKAQSFVAFRPPSRQRSQHKVNVDLNQKSLDYSISVLKSIDSTQKSRVELAKPNVLNSSKTAHNSPTSKLFKLLPYRHCKEGSIQSVSGTK